MATYDREIHQIVSNQVQCSSCGDSPYSAHHHDYKECKCGFVAVDGGQSYLRRVFHSSTTKEHYQERSIVADKSLCITWIYDIQQAIDTKRNAAGIAYAIMRTIRHEPIDIGYTDDGIMVLSYKKG